jgi:hypothetical protein
MVSIIGENNLIFSRLYWSIGLRFVFLMTTIDLIVVFCCQSIIGIDPIYVFLTIGQKKKKKWNRAQSLKFCHKYKNWKESDWEQVMSSDESTFRLVNSRGATVRRPAPSNSPSRSTLSPWLNTLLLSWFGAASGVLGAGGSSTLVQEPDNE